MPHLALPTLTAYLRAQGLEVIQRDLNLEVFDTVLTRTYLEHTLTRLRRMRRSPLPPEMLRSALAHGPTLADQVEPAKAIFRSEAFFDGDTSLPAFLTLVESLNLASLPFYPAALELTSYRPPAPEDSSRSLLQTARDPQRNMFLSIFRQGILNEIKTLQPDIIAISVPTLNQMLAAMTLAHLVKTIRLPAHITVGGPHISMLREQLIKAPEIFTLIDSAIVFSGEVPLLHLAEALSSNGDLSKVPNLIYKDKGGQNTLNIRSTAVQTCPPPNLLPDFDGLPLNRYLTPSPVLPLLSAHGCYHGKCAFCNVGYGGPERFSQLAPELVVEQMVALRDKYSTHHIFFADEAITPRNLSAMSEHLANLDDPIHWCGCVRFDNALSKELLESMARGGCRMLLFGLETASETTIRRMNKGTQVEVMSRILRDSAAAGIWNHTFFFFGFPGETMEHAQETVNFVYAHQDAIHSASPGAFLLERYSPVHQSPTDYGVTQITSSPDRDLAIYFDYAVNAGLDETMADTLADRLLDVLPQKQFGHYYIHDTYRLLYTSDLHQKGKPLPLWLA